MTITAIPTTDKLVAIGAAWSEYVVREHGRSTQTAHPYVYASSRRRCVRRMVYEMTQPEAMPPFGADTLARMARGSDRERDIVTDLARVGRISEHGFDVTGQQETVEVKNRFGRVVIRGRIDGRVKWSDGERWPFECKSWSQFLTDKISTFGDLFTQYWTWSGAFQLLSYLYSTGESDGLLILDRPGLPKLIRVSLEENMQAMEEFLQDAETACAHVDAKTLPDYIQDAGECKRCPFFGAVCNPDLLGGPGAQVFTDDELEAALDRREELKPLADEYNDLDASVKAKLRGVELGIAGRHLIQGKWQKQTTYPDLPKELKAQYAVENPKGKFVLRITSVDGVKP